MPTDAPAAIEIRGLTKRFLSTLALDGVDLTIKPAEIHALVGENGAGKSTLIKILAGLYQPDSGEIFMSGRQVHPHSESVPIAFVHQDLGLVDELSIGENVALVAGFPRSGGLISWSKVWRQAEQIYAGMAVDPPNPRAPVGSLSAAGKAILGIVRALSRDARVVVLDEPTASLPGPDALHLFEVLRRLRASGTSILYVSHRLNELFGLVDRVTVLRDGRLVRSSDIRDATPESIVRDMLGRDLELHHPSTAGSRASAPLLQVENLFTGESGAAVLHRRRGRGCWPRGPARGRPRGDRSHDLRRSSSNRRNDQARPRPCAGRPADQRAHRKRNCAPGGRPTGRKRAERHVAAREPVSQREQRGRRTLSRRSTDGGRLAKRATCSIGSTCARATGRRSLIG